MSTGMKTAISIPDELFEAAEAAAKRLGLSRSRLFCKAMRAFLDEHGAGGVTEKLDEIYADQDSSLDAGTERMQFASLRDRKRNW